jgi:hypothetical protein
MQSRLNKLIHMIVMLVLLTSQAIPLFAQNATGAINGTVKDQSDAIITNATVTAKNKATGASRKVNAGEDGSFTFDALQPGQYEVKVEAQGFSTQIQTLTVEVGSTTPATFALTVGAVTDIVEVAGTSTPIINKTDSTIGGIVNRMQVESLPLNGRSFLSVAGLEPGVTVTYQATSGVLNQNDFFQVGVAGAPSYMTVISVDGARANDRITGGTSQNFSSETVQEFQISTFGFDLSSGTVSAGAVNVISRSGSNRYHGSAFLFFRDHNLSAFPGFKRPSDPTALNPACANPQSPACQRLQDPFFVRKQYGGTMGGPIQKDKLFFFANYERSDQVGAQTVAFSDPLLFGYNHVGKVPFDQHLVGTRLDYRINDKHNAFVRGNIDKNDSISGAGLESNWIGSSNFSYQTQLGISSVFTSKLVNDFRFSYSYFRNRLFPPSQSECEQLAGDAAFCTGVGSTLISFFGGLSMGNNANVPQDRHPRTYQWTDNLSWTKGAHRLRFGVNYEHSMSHGSWSRNFAGTFATFSPAVVAAQNPALYAALPASLKIGYTGPRATIAELLRLPVSGAATIGIGDAQQPTTYLFDELKTNNHIRFYAQDAWQITPSFTLNYGLAWSFEDNVLYHEVDRPEYVRPLGISLNKIPYDLNNFDPALGFAWSVNDKTVIRASASLHHASPNRSYLKLQDQVLNGPAGSGLTSASSAAAPNPKFGQPGQPALLTFTTPQAFTAQELLNYLPTLVALFKANSFSGTDLSVRNIEVRKQAPTYLTEAIFDENYHTPYTIHVNAGLQRELTKTLSVSADFVMRRGVKFGGYEGYLEDVNRWNRFTYTLLPTGTAIPARNSVIPACTAAQAADPKAKCSTGVIYYGSSSILSRYSALQLKLDKRFGSGFQLTGAYALARYTTYVPVLLVNPNSFTDSSKNFGLSAGVPKHQVTFSGIWDLPDYKGDNRFMRGALNGWQLSSIMQMRSRDISSVSLGVFDHDGDGSFAFILPGTELNSFGRGQDADDIRRLVNEYNATIPASQTALPAAITRAQRDALGVAFPYIVLPEKFSSGDSFITQDLRVTRTIAITEKVRLSLIGEGFNIFNIANLGGYSGTLNAYIRPTATVPGRNPNFTFGQPTNRVSPIFGTGGPRAFQLAARLAF